MTQLKAVKVGDYEITTNKVTEVIDWLVGRVNNSQTTAIVTINPEIYLKSLNNPQHFNALKSADLIVPDGVGMIWAGEYYNLQNYKNSWLRFVVSLKQLFFNKSNLTLPQRITGVDLSLMLCQTNILPIKIFGSENLSAEKAKKNLLKLFPNLQIDIYDAVKLTNECEINDLEKDFLFTDKKCIILVALGAPKQEILMHKIKNEVQSGSILIGVGGTIDFIAGNTKRAPKFLQKLGLEWLFRLIREPKRFKRIINAVIVFPLTFIKKY